MTSVVLALVGLIITVIGLIVTLVRYTAKIEVWVNEMRPLVRRIPHIDYRLQSVERHLDIDPPAYLNGSSHEEKN